MMYPYISFSDGTEVTHSQILLENEEKQILVHFERPTESGFDSARCRMPSYQWLFNDGYTAEEIAVFEDFLHNNAHLLYKYAECGGVQIA